MTNSSKGSKGVPRSLRSGSRASGVAVRLVAKKRPSPSARSRAATPLIGARRLLRLAKFLHKLPERKFFFGTVVSGSDMPRKQLDCGSTACAIGWCPVIWPKNLKYVSGKDEWWRLNSYDVGFKFGGNSEASS